LAYVPSQMDGISTEHRVVALPVGTPGARNALSISSL
jgi:hypothetical protein